MTMNRSSVKAIMPSVLPHWWGDSRPGSVGMYPGRQVLVIHGDYNPIQYMERPYASVPDMDIESAYWHGNTILTIPKEKKVDPGSVSTKMLSLLSRANAL